MEVDWFDENEVSVILLFFLKREYCGYEATLEAILNTEIRCKILFLGNVAH